MEPKLSSLISPEPELVREKFLTPAFLRCLPPTHVERQIQPPTDQPTYGQTDIQTDSADSNSREEGNTTTETQPISNSAQIQLQSVGRQMALAADQSPGGKMMDINGGHGKQETVDV